MIEPQRTPASGVLKVSAHSNPNSVAGALAGVLRERPAAELQAIGAGATNQAVKAIAIARSYLQRERAWTCLRPRVHRRRDRRQRANGDPSAGRAAAVCTRRSTGAESSHHRRLPLPHQRERRDAEPGRSRRTHARARRLVVLDHRSRHDARVRTASMRPGSTSSRASRSTRPGTAATCTSSATACRPGPSPLADVVEREPRAPAAAHRRDGRGPERRRLPDHRRAGAGRVGRRARARAAARRESARAQRHDPRRAGRLRPAALARASPVTRPRTTSRRSEAIDVVRRSGRRPGAGASRTVEGVLDPRRPRRRRPGRASRCSIRRTPRSRSRISATARRATVSS